MAIGEPQSLAALPRVAVVEPLRGWWNEEPGFGQQFTGALGRTNVVQSLLDVDLPGPPRAVGVQLHRSDRQVLAQANRDVWAEVEYGAGGIYNTFRCDWRSGTRFTLMAKTVRVSFVPHLSVLGVSTGTLEEILLGATVGINAPGGRSPPTYTPDETALIPTGTSRQSAVPDFATGYNLIVKDPALGFVASTDFSLLQVSFRDANNFTIDAAQGNTIRDALSSVSGYRIPATAQFVNVFNNTGGSIYITNQFVLGI